MLAQRERAMDDTSITYDLTDGIARLLDTEGVHAFRYDGKRYDCGSKLGFLQATVELALQHPEVGAEFTAYWAQRR